MINWNLVIAVFGAVSGFLGVVIGGYSILHNRFTAVHQFISAMDDPKMIAAKKHVYTSDSLPIEDEEAALVVNFYHHWGLMVRLYYLPRHIFDYGLGPGAIRLYNRLQPFITARKLKDDDKTYASNYEWLYHYLVRRYKRPA